MASLNKSSATSGHCLLCLKFIGNVGDQQFPINNIKQPGQILFELSKFLSFNKHWKNAEQKKTGKETETTSNVECFEQHYNPDFFKSLSLCSNCSKMSFKSLELLEQFEKIRMELNYYLKGLQSVVEEADGNRYRIGQFTQKIRKIEFASSSSSKRNLDEGESKLVEDLMSLRSTFLQSCKSNDWRPSKEPSILMNRLQLGVNVNAVKSLAVKNTTGPEIIEVMHESFPVIAKLKRVREDRARNTPRAFRRAQWSLISKEHCKKVPGTGSGKNKPAKWFCDLCPHKEHWVTRKSFRAHYLSAHMGRTFPCGIGQCQAVYKDLGNLRRHRKKCKGLPPPTEFPCKVCGKKFPMYGKMNMHYKMIHLGVNAATCPICHKRFKFRHQMKKHHEAVHLNVRFKCDHPGCGKEFTMKESLIVHTAREHFGQASANPEIAKTESQVTMEIQADPPAKANIKLEPNEDYAPPPLLSPPIELDDEPMDFGNESENDAMPILESIVKVEPPEEIKHHHQISEDLSSDPDPDWVPEQTFTGTTTVPGVESKFKPGDRPMTHCRKTSDGRFCCKLCGRLYRYYYGFIEHYKTTHEGRRYACGIGLCEKVFVGSSHLRQHKLNCKGQPPQEKRTFHECPICKKRFSRLPLLTYHHKLVHLNIRKHSCDICDKKFKELKSVRRHKEQVHMQLKIKCEVEGCNKSYGRKDTLELHHARDHLNIKY